MGLWQNFGGVDGLANDRRILTLAFDRGSTHFALANNYAPSPGSAEETVRKVLKQEIRDDRDNTNN